MKKIYIVEDDAVIADVVSKHLQTWDMQVCTVQNYSKVLDEIDEFKPDLILMDVKLPCYNGFYFCTEIRKKSQIPIIFISSADDNMNIVMAMNMGADDFISKPFDLQVLTAKIQAVLRRSYGTPLASRNLECGDILICLDDASATVKGKPLDLSKNEFLLLKILVENKGRVVSRETLMEKLWGNEEFVDDNTLTVNMTRIRKKLEYHGLEHYIETKRGMGYIIEG